MECTKSECYYEIAKSCCGAFINRENGFLCGIELIKGMNVGVEADIAWIDVWCDRLPLVFVSRLF